MPAKRARWFENKIAQHLVEEAAHSGRSNGLIRGSSIGLKCLRRLGYMVLGYGEEPPTAHSQYVLNFGNAFHDLIQTWMSRSGLVAATPCLDENHHLQWEGNAEGTLLDLTDGITGHYDGLTEPLVVDEKDGLVTCALNPDGKRYLLEFKTISNKSRVHAVYYEVHGGQEYTCKYLIAPGKDIWDQNARLENSPPKKLASRGNENYLQLVRDNNFPSGTLLNVLHRPGAFSEMTKPKDEHIDQATYYASRLKADGILIVYLAKDFDSNGYEKEEILNIPIKAWEVEVSDETVNAIRNRAQSLWEHLEEGAKRGGDPESWLPPRQFHPGDVFSECKFCPYKYVCYPETVNQEKFREAARLQLPVAKGIPFERHSSDDWGREAARSGRVKDKSGQKANVFDHL